VFTAKSGDTGTSTNAAETANAYAAYG